jgi:hypothetical protein
MSPVAQGQCNQCGATYRAVTLAPGKYAREMALVGETDANRPENANLQLPIQNGAIHVEISKIPVRLIRRGRSSGRFNAVAGNRA